MTIAVMGHINPGGSHYMKAGLTDNFGVVTMNLLFSKAQGADVNFFNFQMLFQDFGTDFLSFIGFRNGGKAHIADA